MHKLTALTRLFLSALQPVLAVRSGVLRLLPAAFVSLCTLVSYALPAITAYDGASSLKGVRFEDVPNDGGTGLRVTWNPIRSTGSKMAGFEILLAKSTSDSFVVVGIAGPEARETVVTSGEQFSIQAGVNYYGKIAAQESLTVDVAESEGFQPDIRVVRFESAIVGPFQTKAAWFNTGRMNVLLLILIFFALVLIMVRRARQGIPLHFRRIAGIDAIDEAIGRATELGKPVLYVPGTQDIENIQTIASLQLLTAVSTKTATYDIPIIVPLNRAFMVSVAEESVRQGYMNAGRLDAYNRDNIRYLSDEQFAFTSSVTGIMMREKTAAHLYLGSFFGESLILSETGYSTGAIQIAGTANIHQLPFFVVACDYTLIGEEYFATSGLVTRNPELLGTLKATDWIKLILISALGISAILEMFGISFIRSWFVIP